MSQPSADFPEITAEYCCFQDQVRNGDLSPHELRKKFWSLYEEDPEHFNWCIATYHGSNKHDDVVMKNSRFFQMKTLEERDYEKFIVYCKKGVYPGIRWTATRPNEFKTWTQADVTNAINAQAFYQK